MCRYILGVFSFLNKLLFGLKIFVCIFVVCLLILLSCKFEVMMFCLVLSNVFMIWCLIYLLVLVIKIFLVIFIKFISRFFVGNKWLNV